MFFALSSKKVKEIKIDDKEREKERKSPLEPMVLECLYTFILFFSLSFFFFVSLRFSRMHWVEHNVCALCCYVIASIAVLFHFSFFFHTWTRAEQRQKKTTKDIEIDELRMKPMKRKREIDKWKWQFEELILDLFTIEWLDAFLFVV